MTNLNQEETEILNAYETGQVTRSKKAKNIQKKHQEYAKAMLKKDARINIRLSSKDLHNLQKKAIVEGIPYQTLVASIIHKYVEGHLREST